MEKIVFVAVVITIFVTAKGVPAIDGESNSQNVQQAPSDIFRSIGKCSNEGSVTYIVNCAAARVLRSVEYAASEQKLDIFPGVTLESDLPQSKRIGKKLQDVQLPEEPKKKTAVLMDMLLEATNRFFAGRTLKIKLPKSSPQIIARALEEGRGKMKKMVGPLMLGLGTTMVTMVPVLLGGLSLLATKALLVAKIALVVSVIVFIQYFFANRNPGGFFTGYGYNTYGSYGAGTNSLGGWGGTSPQYPYARSLEVQPGEVIDNQSAQDVAYSGHK